MAIDFAQVRVRDLVLVSHTGEVKEGEARVNKAAFAIHAAIHRAGTPVPIPHEVALAARDQAGDAKWGRFNFAPLCSRVVRDEPDVFD